MSETATLSTIIDIRVKDAVTAFCKRRGIKMRYLIEQALIEQLEDEIDLEFYNSRRNEETVSLEAILAGLEKEETLMAYTIEFVRSARKEFERLPDRIRENTTEALRLLAQNPYSALLKVKKLKGAAELYRIRLSDYRLVYELRNDQLLVIVIKIGHRREVYR